MTASLFEDTAKMLKKIFEGKDAAKIIVNRLQ